MELTNEQKHYQDDLLKRATAYEEMVRVKGWEHLRENFENRLKKFVNGLLVSEEPIEKFESERREIMGIRKLLASIDSDLQSLERFRKGNGGQ